MKLTYFVSECLNDSNAYSIRRKRKYEVLAELQGSEPTTYQEQSAFRTEAGVFFGPVHKVEVEFEDSFDLLCQCLGEGGIDEA